MAKDYVIGIDAGGTKVAYGLFDRAGEIVDRMQHPTDAEADGPAFSDQVINNVKSLANKHNLAFDKIEGIGIGMPSFILYDEGRILMTSAMTKIKDFPMRKYLETRLPTRIVLDNDSNAAAIAEHRHGAGRGTRHMVYMSFGTGLGSGLIFDGKLFRGTYGWAGESGHMLATPDAGVICGCENSGCFMSYVSGHFIPVHVKAGLKNGFRSDILNPDTVDGCKLLEAMTHGDELACHIIEQIAHYLAVCVYNIYQLLNINTFVFGGGLTNLGDKFFSRVYELFNKYNHIPLPVYFKMAELKTDFGIIGAAELLREHNVE
ncbi:MAG: ROK family protein [Oscillospiraceae bacterium]|nr:ROK family protein [Oscillospiraceae bacterium]